MPTPEPMATPATMARLAWRCLRSLSALLAAAIVLVAGTWASGELAALLALPAGGQPRLAWDLAGLALSGTAAFALLSRLAPFAAGAHVIAALVALSAIALWAVLEMGQDFPAWFNATLLLSLPMQAYTGWRLSPAARGTPR